MSNTQMFTTALTADVLAWLKKFAKKHNQTQRSVLEEALKRYRFEMRRREFREGFKHAMNDPEMLELAEMGLDDWEEQIKQFEL